MPHDIPHSVLCALCIALLRTYNPTDISVLLDVSINTFFYSDWMLQTLRDKATDLNDEGNAIDFSYYRQDNISFYQRNAWMKDLHEREQTFKMEKRQVMNAYSEWMKQELDSVLSEHQDTGFGDLIPIIADYARLRDVQLDYELSVYTYHGELNSQSVRVIGNVLHTPKITETKDPERLVEDNGSR
jgi:hypothetical protein